MKYNNLKQTKEPQHQPDTSDNWFSGHCEQWVWFQEERLWHCEEKNALPTELYRLLDGYKDIHHYHLFGRDYSTLEGAMEALERAITKYNNIHTPIGSC